MKNSEFVFGLLWGIICILVGVIFISYSEFWGKFIGFVLFGFGISLIFSKEDKKAKKSFWRWDMLKATFATCDLGSRLHL